MKRYTEVEAVCVNSKTDLLLGIINSDKNSISDSIKDLYEKTLPLDSILEFLSIILSNMESIIDFEIINFIFLSINNIYKTNIDIERYSYLSEMIINRRNISEIDVKSLLSDSFIDECNEDFIRLFLNYYLNNLLYSINIDYNEISRINEHLKRINNK